MSNHIYLTNNELAGQRATKEEVEQLVRLFNRRFTLQYLSIWNNLLTLFPPTSSLREFIAIQRGLFAIWLKPELQEKVREIWESKSIDGRPLVSRQHLLLLMKFILLNGLSDGGLDPNESADARLTIGDLCLMTSDLLVTSEQEARGQSETPLEPAESERIMNELLCQLLPVTELMNPPELMTAIARTRDYLEISSREYPSAFKGHTLSAEFQRLTGLSLERFVQMVVGVYAIPVLKSLTELLHDTIGLNVTTNHFEQLDYSEGMRQAFFDLTTSKFEELATQTIEHPRRNALQLQYDFTVFRNHPLFYVTPDVLTSVDYSFVVEKVSFGIYYTIHNVLLAHSIHPGDFFQHWGYVFEHYVNELFQRIYPGSLSQFRPNLFYLGKQRMEAFDGIVEYPNALIVMQYKGGLLNSRAKYSGDVETLLGALDSKFGTKENNSGIKQLSLNIERLFNADKSKRKRIDNLDVTRIGAVYPVLIVNDLSMQNALAHWRLKTWFEQEIDARTITSDVRVGRLVVLTIEDLEMIAPYLEEGIFPLLDFIGFCAALEYQRFPWFRINPGWYHPMTGMHEVFGRFRDAREIAHLPNPRREQNSTDFFAEIMTSFRDSASG